MVMNPQLQKRREHEKRILEYAYLVEQVAQRVKRRIPEHIEYEELCSIGFIGLLEAMERYDDEKSVPFRVYAEIRVNGAMLDFLRKEDWMPRNLRQQVKEIQRAEHRLQHLGKEQTDRNIAEVLHLSEEEVRNVRGETHRQTIQGSYKVGDSEMLFLEECVADTSSDIVQQLIDQEGEVLVHQAVQQLPNNERRVVVAYFMYGLNLREIGERLGVTESRACQLRKSGIARLQKWLQPQAA
jgi:RNA polymerase sigma factor for flagellar operon FliA